MRPLPFLLIFALLVGCSGIELPEPTDTSPSLPNLPTFDFRFELDEPDPEPTTTRAEIVMVTGRGCFWCDKQKAELEPNEGGYRIRYVNVLEDVVLLAKWKIPPFAPTVAVVIDGEAKHKFIGFTPWSEIEAVAGEAKR